MEISTVLGLVIGFAMMVGVLMVGESHVSLTKFIDPPAMMMVFGGAIAVTLVGFPLKQVMNIFSILKKPFFAKADQPSELIEQIVSLAETARKDGLLALEGKTQEIKNPFITLGIQLSVDGTRSEVVEEIMRTEVDALEGRHREAKQILELVGPLRAGLRHDRHAAWA